MREAREFVFPGPAARRNFNNYLFFQKFPRRTSTKFFNIYLFLKSFPAQSAPYFEIIFYVLGLVWVPQAKPYLFIYEGAGKIMSGKVRKRVIFKRYNDISRYTVN